LSPPLSSVCFFFALFHWTRNAEKYKTREDYPTSSPCLDSERGHVTSLYRVDLLRIALILPSLSPADSSHSRIPIDDTNRGAPRLPRRPAIHRLSPHIPLPARRTGRLRCPRSLPKRYCSLPLCASGVAVLDNFLVRAQEVFVLMPPRPGGRETSGRITRGPLLSLDRFFILAVRHSWHPVPFPSPRTHLPAAARRHFPWKTRRHHIHKRISLSVSSPNMPFLPSQAVVSAPR
jgi:hypothetical protein